jgi:hypothetical protein
MACIGCVVGAAGFAAMYGGGKLVEWASNLKRSAAMKRAEAGELAEPAGSEVGDAEEPSLTPSVQQAGA